tara:strand:+ start:176 stop:655 length:480 start_codon:yes stop_codon:yes gene_type:complete
MKPKILIIISDYYLYVANGLQVAAEYTLNEESISKVKYKIIKVPGVFEIPVIISKNIKKYDGFIALGCVIKGETPHFDHISKTSINAIMKLSVDNKKPIGMGIITALDIGQANLRSSRENFDKNILKSSVKGKLIKPNKGYEASRAVLSVLGILKNEPK